jgi:hypothetical protein
MPVSGTTPLRAEFWEYLMMFGAGGDTTGDYEKRVNGSR